MTLKRKALAGRAYLRHFRAYWLRPVRAAGLRRTLTLYGHFMAEWRRYAGLPGSEPLRIIDSYPCLFDRTAITEVDAHYFYQAVWAAKAIRATGAGEHVDVGSQALFVGMLSAFTRVIFIDIRPLQVDVPDLVSRQGNILALPFARGSVASLSCLHVAEHIGLGRYGDALDPHGTVKAAHELGRVLAPGGHLYFSVPVGQPRVCFNAHRIHAPAQVLDYFAGLTLVDYAVVDDRGVFRQGGAPDDSAGARYACGMFHFVKRAGGEQGTPW